MLEVVFFCVGMTGHYIRKRNGVKVTAISQKRPFSTR